MNSLLEVEEISSSGNMKVITAIYLNCRPELRDEWLAGTDQEGEWNDGLVGRWTSLSVQKLIRQPQEHAIRALIQFYNKRYYAPHLAALASPEPIHKRSDSTAAVTLDELQPMRPLLQQHRPSLVDADVFPPRRTDAGQAYNPDEMIEFWLHEYEDVLTEVFGDGGPEDPWDDGEEDFGLVIAPRAFQRGAPGPAETGDRAWSALEEIMGDADSISDSESIVSVGDLGDDARLDEADNVVEGVFAAQQRRRSTGNENTWEVGPIQLPSRIMLIIFSKCHRQRYHYCLNRRQNGADHLHQVAVDHLFARSCLRP